jgi:hypothetical protein
VCKGMEMRAYFGCWGAPRRGLLRTHPQRRRLHTIGLVRRKRGGLLTAIEQDAFGEFAHLLSVASEQVLEFLRSSIALIRGKRYARTTHMFSRSSMTSRGDDCTLIIAAYFTAFASILPTKEVNDGRPWFPGGGCVMSAPDWPSA